MKVQGTSFGAPLLSIWWNFNILDKKSRFTLLGSISGNLWRAMTPLGSISSLNTIYLLCFAPLPRKVDLVWIQRRFFKTTVTNDLSRSWLKSLFRSFSKGKNFDLSRSSTQRAAQPKNWLKSLLLLPRPPLLRYMLFTWLNRSFLHNVFQVWDDFLGLNICGQHF